MTIINAAFSLTSNPSVFETSDVFCKIQNNKQDNIFENYLMQIN